MKDILQIVRDILYLSRSDSKREVNKQDLLVQIKTKTVNTIITAYEDSVSADKYEKRQMYLPPIARTRS